MLDRKLIRGLERCEEFDIPQSGRGVWQLQYCPKFKLRRHWLQPMENCFYCAYADFKLHGQESLEIGTCCYPEVKFDLA